MPEEKFGYPPPPEREEDPEFSTFMDVYWLDREGDRADEAYEN